MLVRAPLPQQRCTALAPATKSFLFARRNALSRDSRLERDVVDKLFQPTSNGSNAPVRLQSVSFVRQVNEEDRLEYEVEYSRAKDGNNVVVRVVQPTGADAIVPVTIADMPELGESEAALDRMDVDIQSDEMVSLWSPMQSLPWSFEPLSDSSTQLENAARILAAHNAAVSVGCPA